MNYYNIQYSPKERKNPYQRIINNKKIKIHGHRTIKKNKTNLVLHKVF